MILKKSTKLLVLLLCIFATTFTVFAAPKTKTVLVAEENVIATQIKAELDYIVNSSWTSENKNSGRWYFIGSTDDIYGAINSNRVPYERFAGWYDWVEPGTASMGMVGMLQGTNYLYNNGVDISKYNSVIDKFFLTWELAHGQARNTDSNSPDFGAFMSRVDYDLYGNYETSNPNWKTDVTAQMMIANWKYYEYKTSINQIANANAWINNAWQIQKNAADYLVRMYDTTPAGSINLLPGNSSTAEYSAWTHFASYAVPALRSASSWAKKVNAPYADYDRVADGLVIGIQSMKDAGTWHNYYKFRPYENGVYGAPQYGDSVDQLTFSPYETGAVSVDAYAGEISDWWTEGDGGGVKMTYQSNDSSDWRYFGTRWHYYFDGRAENNYLYPGPGFQLAKVEWKYGNSTNNSTYTDRSQKRLDWAKGTAYSSLWWFATGEIESKIPNGFQDWRDSNNYSHEAEVWARFVDTSAYFIEVLLMNETGLDTDYNPIIS